MVFLGAQAATILSQIDMQMIIFLLWTTDAWYYTNYLSIIWIPFMIIGPIFWLLFPLFSEMHSKWEYNKIKITKSMFQKNFLAIWIAFNLLFFIFSETIAYILFWEKFITSWKILQYSILLLVFNFLFQINFNIMAWIGKVKERIKVILIAIIFNIVANIILIKIMWVYWAALATSLWWLLIWILSEVFLGKDFKVSFDWKFLTKNIFYMWLLSIFLYYFVEPSLEWLSRWYSAFILTIISIIWFSIFILINIKEFKFFTLEIKKLKKWTTQ
jgi:O-antigen/teichoic acid export membrane protein